jgi:uroporphyrinogen-III synthase
MSILITRPEPDCHELTQQLNAAGINAIAQPLLTIKAGNDLPDLINQLKNLKTDDFLIVISVHAVNLAHNYLMSQDVCWPKNVHYIAVGHKTAATLKRVTGQKVISPQTRCDSEGLLALPELANVTDRQILILRGNGGRELIYQTLTERNAKVSYCETYQRTWLALNGEALCRTWQAQNVSTLVVTSGEQLAYLTHLVPKQYLTWFFQCHLFVPSQRIANQAKNLGYKNFSTVGSASNKALFTFLSKIGSMG